MSLQGGVSGGGAAEEARDEDSQPEPEGAWSHEPTALSPGMSLQGGVSGGGAAEEARDEDSQPEPEGAWSHEPTALSPGMSLQGGVSGGGRRRRRGTRTRSPSPRAPGRTSPPRSHQVCHCREAKDLAGLRRILKNGLT
ncbi:hypothetical protein JYU34_004292 [Plutella xylostella]|uniref:Uncharacterized protein n=1 Tax=Plutella xylostella TaxID=51655 RepID=A0ABQ7QXM0_PLUXY|nr:hypothetical protein JYU34_004292 [Plutella xylostella]